MLLQACRRFLLTPLALCFALWTPCDAAGDWPTWRGPDQNGASREQQVPVAWGEDQGIEWKCALPEWGNSTPIIWGEAIFLTSHVDDRDLLLIRIDRKTGQINWTRQVGTATTPRVSLSIKTGDERRHTKFHNSQTLASPSCTTDGEIVVVHFGNGDLAAYDFEGQPLWKRNLQDDHGPYTIWWGHANSPVLFGDLVISVCMQDSCSDLSGEPSLSYIVAHDKRTGKRAWFMERPTEAQAEHCDSYTTPILRNKGNRVELIVWGGQILDAYNPQNGKRLWWLSGLEGNRVIPGPVISDDVIYVTQGMRSPMLAVQLAGDGMSAGVQPLGCRGQAEAWTPTTGDGARSAEDILWTYDGNTSDSPSPVISGDYLFFTTNNGIATCLDRRNGELVWRERLPGQYRASPLLAEGRVYFMNTQGVTSIVTASPRFEKLAENRLEDETIASPAVAGSRLYIRGRKWLYCIVGN